MSQNLYYPFLKPSIQTDAAGFEAARPGGMKIFSYLEKLDENFFLPRCDFGLLGGLGRSLDYLGNNKKQ